MRYYIVDYNGVIWTDCNTKADAEARLESYTAEEIEENELEIIESI